MAAEIKFTVDAPHGGKTVEKILRTQFNISSSMLTFLKLNSRLFKNGLNCRTIDICEVGDIIIADVSENIPKPPNIDLWEYDPEILYDDDFLTVVNKPGGMEVHPCPTNRKTTLANAVMYYWSKFGVYHNYHIVNRLDKDTSGICVIAKNRFAHGVLSSQMKSNLFRRGYTAITHGIFNPPSGTIELPISRDSGSIIKRVVNPDGKFAKTNYSTLQTLKNKWSVVDIQLETGRTHQIRVHFSHIEHPLVGDWLYGNGDNERDLIKRHALHAHFVEFFHPFNSLKMVFNCDMPDDMKKLINTL